MSRLGRDVIGLADALKISKFAFCGLSMGGAIGQWLALNAPDRVSGLVLANTSPQFGPRTNWETRMRTASEKGMAGIVEVVMPRFFSSETLARGDAHANAVRSVLLGTNPAGYAGCCAALRDFDQTRSLGKIRIPTLVIVGDHDVSTPWAGHGEILAREIPGARASASGSRSSVEPGTAAIIHYGAARLPLANTGGVRGSAGRRIRGAPGGSWRYACGPVHRRLLLISIAITRI